MRRTLILSCGFVLFLSYFTHAQTRLEKVLGDREKFIEDGSWIYQDLPAAMKAAEAEDKPLMVILRCIPCEECVKLDDDVFEEDAAIKPLLEKFVRARIVSTNGLDLATFQFDTDNSWMCFFLNADGTIYGRYGTRSDRTEWKDDVSVAGLAKAMQLAVDLHEEYPANKESLAGKRGPKPKFKTPEQYPSLKPKYKSQITFNKNVVQSCIHCHQIGDAERLAYREAGEPIPEKILFPYPHPKAIGLIMDPQYRARILRVEKESPAALSGFEAGWDIDMINGQPILSLADIQWVLHNTPPEGAELNVGISQSPPSNRGIALGVQKLKLENGWRRRDDIGWRVSSWPLRRMGTGGLKLDALSGERRRELDIAEDKMALLVMHVGQYGPHAAAKRAGFQKGDIIVGFDGRDDLLRDGDLLAYAVNNRKPGERVKVDILRGNRAMQLTLPMQK